MFKYKNQEELEKMSAEELKQYHADMKAHEKSEREKEIKEATENVEKNISAKIEDAQKKTDEQMKELSDDFNALAEKLRGVDSMVDVNKVVEDFITDNHDAIKSAFKSGNGKIDISKAVGIVTTANGTLPTALPANFVAERDGVPNVRLRRPTLLDHVNTFSTNTVSLPYVEAIPGEGDFAVVAEGGTKPQLDLDWVTRFVTPTKFAGWIKVTEEAIDDIPRLRDMIVNYLRSKHDLFKEKQVFTYINTTATAYVTGGSLSGSVSMPTIMDVVGAIQSQIINTPNYVDEPNFMGDTVLMNDSDFFKYFGFAKDALGRPLYDNGYQVGNTFRLNGFTFVATGLVTAGNIIVYDSTKIDVTTYIPYNVEIGWVNDDFIKNQFVILGESRGHIYIKNHDKRAFVKGSISAIMTDIEKVTPTPTP